MSSLGSTPRGACPTSQASSADHALRLRSLARVQAGVRVRSFYNVPQLQDFRLVVRGSDRHYLGIIPRYGGSNLLLWVRHDTKRSKLLSRPDKKRSVEPRVKDSCDVTYMDRGCAKLCDNGVHNRTRPVRSRLTLAPESVTAAFCTRKSNNV